jgi:hypothetical protein
VRGKREEWRRTQPGSRGGSGAFISDSGGERGRRAIASTSGLCREYDGPGRRRYREERFDARGAVHQAAGREFVLGAGGSKEGMRAVIAVILGLRRCKRIAFEERKGGENEGSMSLRSSYVDGQDLIFQRNFVPL